MKTKRIYRFPILTIIILLGAMGVSAENYVKTFTFNFAPEDFEFSGKEEVNILPGIKFYEDKEIIFHYGQLGTPALLYFEYPILIPDNYRMKDFTYSLVDETAINQVVSEGNILTADSITLAPTPLEVSGTGPHPEVPEYPLITYPAEVVHTGNVRCDGYKPEMFEINPFTYHATDRKLVLATSITLTVTIEPDNNFKIPDGRDDEAIKDIKFYVHNPEDIEKGIENWQPLTTDETRTTEFSVTGTKWYANNHYSNRWGESTNTTVCYSLDGDTLIDKNVWKKLYKEASLLGYLREADGKVWVYPENIGDLYPYEKGKPFILYDFTLQKGDTIYLNLRTIGITSTPNSDYDNLEYIVKEVRIEHGRKIIDFGYEQWIEGVGSNSSAFFDFWEARPTNGSSSWEEVYQVVSDGKTIYFNGEVADPNAKSWLQEGMAWTQNWNYNESSDGQFRQITLTEEIRPGTFVLGWHSSWPEDYIFEYMQDFNGKVYAMQNGRIELCYDFTVQKGNTITLLSYWYEDPISYHKIIQYDTCTVSKVDSVEYNGIMHKRIILTGNREDVWVEGIGSLTRALPIDGMMPFATCKWDSIRITCFCKDEETLYLHPNFIDCTTSKASGIDYKDFTNEVSIQFTASTLLCTAPNAVKMEVYTMDAIKVGEAAFQGGEAKVKVSNVPAMYLYIVTYPDGRRESGKARGN